jgi:hypothetical protein
MRCWKGIAYPDVEVEIPVGDGLDVESNSRYRRNHLSNLYSHQYSDPPNFQRLRGRQASYLQSVEKCGLPSVILEPRVSSLRRRRGRERAQIPNPRSGSGSPSSTTATPTTRTCWHPSLLAVPGRGLASPFFSKEVSLSQAPGSLGQKPLRRVVGSAQVSIILRVSSCTVVRSSKLSYGRGEGGGVKYVL